MPNEIKIIENVNCYEKDGVAYLKLEDVARGLGFTRVANSGNEVVRWERVDGYLRDFGVPTCGHDGYIPENIFYRLAMKAKNETAEAFQAKVADEIIPAIRKTGGYVSNAEQFVTSYFPEAKGTLKDFLVITLDEKKRVSEENVQMRAELEEARPKVTYYDIVLQCKDLLTTTEISKDYGMSAVKFNQILHEFGVQYKKGKRWFLYAKHDGKGLAASNTSTYNKKNGETGATTALRWTQKGRLFLYEFLKKIDILPVVEQEFDIEDIYPDHCYYHDYS